MALRSDNAFHALEQITKPTGKVFQLALVVMANGSGAHALDMLAGKREELQEQRKRLILLLAGFPDEGGDAYGKIQEHAYAYVGHYLD